MITMITMITINLQPRREVRAITLNGVVHHVPPMQTGIAYECSELKSLSIDGQSIDITNLPNFVRTDTEEPDAVEPDAVEPDAVEPDAEEPDAVEPDAVEPDAVEPDAVEPDAVEPDQVTSRPKFGNS